MKDHNYTHKQYTKDNQNLLQRYNSNDIDLETYQNENKNLIKKLTTKEILKDSRGVNSAAQLSAIDTLTRELNIDEKKLEKFYDRELSNNSYLINFNLGGNFNTLNQISDFKYAILKAFVDQGFSDDVRDIGVPTTEDIDYSIIKNVKNQKYGEIVQPYKDGVLIVKNENPKGNHFFMIYEYEKQKEKVKNVVEPIFRTLEKSYYINKNVSDKLIKHKDNFNIYFCFTKHTKIKYLK